MGAAPLIWAISGSRNFPYRDVVESWVRSIAYLGDSVILHTGGALGVDTWAEHTAIDLGIPYRRFDADWDTYGKRAGFLRNEQMIQGAFQLQAFWDGKSNGTLHAIKYAASIGVDAKVIVMSGIVSEEDDDWF